MNKKSTPFGAPVSKQDYGTTPKGKSHAQALFDKIGTGPERAVRRPKDSFADRKFRELISNANKNGDHIINDGNGYYRAGKDDQPELEHYLRAELKRAKESTDKVDAMRESYFGRY